MGRNWVIILMRKHGPSDLRAIPFGPYTHEEMREVLDNNRISVREDEYLTTATLRTLGN